MMFLIHLKIQNNLLKNNLLIQKKLLKLPNLFKLNK